MPRQLPANSHPRKDGFTVIELLLVVAILGALLALSVGIYGSAFGVSARFTRESEGLERFLKEIQQVAKSSQNHCYVGFIECAKTPDGQWVAAQDTNKEAPTNHVVSTALLVGAFARKDGEAGYTPKNPRVSWAESTLNGDTLRLKRAVQIYSALRLLPSLPPPVEGGMARPDVSRFQRIGHSAAISVTPIPLKLDSETLNLQRVIHFSPNGETRVVHQTTADTLVSYVEVGLVPQSRNLSHPDSGTTHPKGGDGLQAAIQISGVTGRVHLFLP
ncbi:MAG: type II secretion system protein [Verrucomicrobiota bacterium]